MNKQTTLSREEARKAAVAKALMALPKLQVDEKMRLALQLGCSTKKIERYTDGDVRKVQFGEVLLSAINDFIATNKPVGIA
jgi:hypothetical protein